MSQSYHIYTFLDLLGTFVFALSGAVAARQKGLDIFGIFSIAFSVACGGGIVRDLCIGAVPPAGLSNELYLIMVLTATLTGIAFYHVVSTFNHPVLIFDAVGLSAFAVSGARKALFFQHNYEVAILLGVVTAVGGGVIRDILLDRIPVILKKEIYASAALVGATIVVAGEYWGLPSEPISALAILTCFGLRYLGLHYHWNLPTFSGQDKERSREE